MLFVFGKTSFASSFDKCPIFGDIRRASANTELCALTTRSGADGWLAVDRCARVGDALPPCSVGVVALTLQSKHVSVGFRLPAGT